MQLNSTRINFLSRYAYALITLIFAILLLAYYATQAPITFNNGEGFDGVKYVDITQQFRAEVPIEGPAPFVYRLTTPYLAALLPVPILDAYFLLNSFFALISGFLLFYWLRQNRLNIWLSLGFVLYLFLHWQASLRFTLFYPADCDPLAIIYILSGFILLKKLNENFSWKHIILLTFLVFTGVFQREFILSLAFGIPVLSRCFYYKKGQILIEKPVFIRNLKAFALVFATGIIGIWITHLLVNTVDNGYGFLHAVYRWMHQKSVFQLVAGFFYTLGILFILPFLFPKSLILTLKREIYMLPIAVIALILAWISGGDTERFILWYAPFYFLIISTILQNHPAFFLRKRIWIPLVLSLILTLRVFWEIPQFYLDDPGVSYPFFAVFGNNNFVDILATHAAKWVTTANLILYLLLSLYFVYWRFEDKILNLIRWK